MKVVITGGAGFIGSRLARTLLENNGLLDNSGAQFPLGELVIFDQARPQGLPEDSRLRFVEGQLDDPVALKEALEGADSVFHFASVVSGAAEADLALGLRVNLDGTRLLLDILAEAPALPKLIFASSVAVYGGDGGAVDDNSIANPMSSYGVQKVCCELLVSDYSRRGLLDGRSLRFPTIGVRPGKANRANSSFISNIIREPLAGRKTVCPVSAESEIALMSPARLIDCIVKAHNLSAEEFGWPRTLMLPAVRVSVLQMLEALAALTGPDKKELVEFEPDAAIIEMVGSWPVDLRAERAVSLGFQANRNAKEIVQEYMRENA